MGGADPRRSAGLPRSILSCFHSWQKSLLISWVPEEAEALSHSLLGCQSPKSGPPPARGAKAMLDPECGYHTWNSAFKSTEGGPPWLAKTEWEKSLVLMSVVLLQDRTGCTRLRTPPRGPEGVGCGVTLPRGSEGVGCGVGGPGSASHSP